MTRHPDQRAVLAVQAAIALAILTAASGIRLAAVSAAAAVAVLVTRQRGTRTIATVLLTAAAVIAIATGSGGLASPASRIDRVRTGGVSATAPKSRASDR